MIVIPEPLSFEWNSGNQEKNWQKHKVSVSEAEEVFFDQDRKIATDFMHSETENRYLLIGKTKKDRALFIVFTVREQKVRIISARDLNKREYALLG